MSDNIKSFQFLIWHFVIVIFLIQTLTCKKIIDSKSDFPKNFFQTLIFDQNFCFKNMLFKNARKAKTLLFLRRKLIENVIFYMKLLFRNLIFLKKFQNQNLTFEIHFNFKIRFFEKKIVSKSNMKKNFQFKI